MKHLDYNNMSHVGLKLVILSYGRPLIDNGQLMWSYFRKVNCMTNNMPKDVKYALGFLNTFLMTFFHMYN
jgi:hypothetical protein